MIAPSLCGCLVYVRDISLEKSNPTRARIGGKNAAESGISVEVGAESGAFEFRRDTTWEAVREIIRDCSDLPADARLELIQLGDSASTTVTKWQP